MILPAGPLEKGPAGFSVRCGLEWAFDPEQMEAAVEADKQREQAEKACKRPQRSFDRER